MRNYSPCYLAVGGALLLPASARVLQPEEQLAALVARAFPANAPNGYTPQVRSCPSDISIRPASDLSTNETEWLEKRRAATIDPMRDLLGRLNITGFDSNQYIDNNRGNTSALPNIGIAASGGGYRAMLNGAGLIQAFDSRTPNSTNAGQLGGLLQATTYLSGLSGGSWLVSSLYANNFTSVDAIITADSDSDNLWQLQNSIFDGPDTGGIQLLDSLGYYKTLVDLVDDKENAGFNTTITDYWGRALSYQLINATDGGPAYTFSSIAQQEFFTNGSVPLPLVVADSRAPGQKVVSTNSTVFTFSPWELGSDDPSLYAFAPLQYVGTNFTDGSPRNNDECVVGYDNLGFVFGTSSSLFNAALTTLSGQNGNGAFSSLVVDALKGVLEKISSSEEDIADWVNPFFGYNNKTYKGSSDMMLTLVDGGEDGQNIPLHPLIQPNRNVDVIFAIDSSADTNETWPTANSATGWPNGVSIVTTYERSLSEIGNNTAFPAVPDINTFMNLGLNNKPTFFGCDAGNLTGPAPLVVYMPNSPYTYASNTSTFMLKYNMTERDGLILNAYNGATQGNGTIDSEWPACVGCAILSRSFDRTGTTVPDACKQCFQRYCWDGTVNSTAPGDYIPEFKVAGASTANSGGKNGAKKGAAGKLGVSVLAALGTAVVAGMVGL
ncbi:unnamed protein product [Zymoseptoria tritici ST99CH_1A5]|uniref:Lysophospholipase n=1 Tax=Zymoseptoria tritici ST99CH_1A5 TaxID=1276529 RepID=A0A1Y6L6E8_ZYMTR|nr:unnamed protein product [Zymoseptoria tritici ST99CH_1A5]